jgi:acyl-CoA synthetase (AMP-forming)/AMP-acid ligase II
MHNSTAFVLIWLACMSINVVPAFINNSLTGNGLIHCVVTSKASLVIYESELEGPLLEIQEQLSSKSNVKSFLSFDDGIQPSSEKAVPRSTTPQLANAVYFGPADLAKQSIKSIDPAHRKALTPNSSCALIYTSGTTGLPKAALCGHGRMAFATALWTKICGCGPNDRIYTPMPIYHSSAAFLCVGVGMRSGATIIIGRKFSASKYWAEVRANDATVVQYIGEIARYLLAVPPHPDDKNHRVRLAYGNGMRPDVWEKFRQRFGVPHIFEFYASSEGNGGLLNYNTGPFGAGAIGRFGALAGKVRPDYKIIQVDAITEDVVRDEKGFCVLCEPGQPGEFIMRIKTDKAHSQFLGYADNPEATKKKVLNNVFAKGDAWFRSGDLMSQDADGHYWFGDRLGDTFRWRSENVSTAEVSAALGEVVGEANVYGVLVPNHDGRAGCAAIPRDSAATMDLTLLAAHARKSLPKYSVPLFLRIVPSIDATGTVKQLKVALRNEGIEHAKCGVDPLYWLPPGAKSYLPFHSNDYAALEKGLVKL